MFLGMSNPSRNYVVFYKLPDNSVHSEFFHDVCEAYVFFCMVDGQYNPILARRPDATTNL